ncbi:MAG: ATP-dependent helicase [Thermodesulfobacteriota bacterium]
MTAASGSPRTMDYRLELNPAQYEAVTALDGPILVAAGAGSGKTRTLVYRVAYLVEKGVPPEAILLLTFTRKAASQMLDRAQALVGPGCSRVAGGTFHALAHELLRRYAPRLGYDAGFGVMDRGDMEELLGRLRQALPDRDRRFPQRSTLADVISKAANKGRTIADLVLEEYVHLKEFLPDIMKLAQEYAAGKRDNALLDFDDLLLELARLLSQDESARREIAARYQYIMVDEYQDTNPMQADIVYLLGRDHGRVMAVGDDAQSIYSFRGATFRNIMDFPSRFPGARVIRLEENYRSRQPILDLTNHIISRARERYEKRLYTRRAGGRRPRIIVTATQKDQSLFVCRKILALRDRGVDLGRVAVLFRAASHSFDLEIELLRHGLDFVKFGGRRFLESAHIKDLLALLRTTANPGDSLSLTRALLLLDGIGPKAAAEISSWVAGRRERLVSLLDYPGRSKQTEVLAPLARLWAEIAVRNVGLEERVNKTWEYYRPVMEAKFDDHPSRLADVKEFLRLAQGYTSLNRFLADMALEPPNALNPRGLGPAGLEGRLTLSTVHSAKGLEWRVVFVIWAVEGRFPPPYALTRPEDLDEERRLMYVAATRAEDELYLICPLEKEEYRPGPARPRPSRFLADLPPELVSFQDEDEPETKPSRAPVPPAWDRPEGQADAADPEQGSTRILAPGDRVSHPVFGLGRVLGLVARDKIRIDFDHFGTKTLALSYAGLKKTG